MKKSLFTAVLGVVIVFLSACGKENRDGAVVVEQTEVSADGEENVMEEYREIYGQIVSGEESDASIFSLIYLDGDEVPELVICDRGYGTYSVYTVKDGMAFCMIDSLTTVEMAYFEREGVVSQFARWNGGGDEGGYGWYYYQVSGNQTITDEDEPVLYFSYDAVYDEEGNWTGEGITKYYHLGQEIDEETYRKLMGDLGIIEGSEKSCVDTALGKQEMLDQLGEMGQSQEKARMQAQEKAAGAQDGQILDQSFETKWDELSEEELIELLNERMEYYRKSAYYPEIVDYWENVREVRDISNQMEPLYESDVQYLTEEDLALVPPVVIYLAKNEIYARHGYIFKNQDLYNYFMGCIWYTPTTAPEDFDDEVFNEYEKENLKLLDQLDVMMEDSTEKSDTSQTNPMREAYSSVLETLYKTYTLPDGTNLGYDEIRDLSLNYFAIYDLDQDGKEELIITWTTTYMAGMTGIVYGYDDASGTVRTELIEFPAQTFYDNGVVEVFLSHNHGLAGEIDDFWPYTFYKYDKGTDVYLCIAEVDAWNKEYYELDYDGKPFPDDMDVDGDGILYKVTIGNDEKLMDLEEYKNWQESVIEGAKKIEIPFVEMTEDNIQGK